MITKGTKEWGEHMHECVARGYGVMLNENTAIIRNYSSPSVGIGFEVGDVRTGKSIDIRITPKGNKIEVEEGKK